MVLTEEQRERIRKNKERALQIQKERKQKEQNEKEDKNINYNNNNKRQSSSPAANNNDNVVHHHKEEEKSKKKQKTITDSQDGSSLPLEDFEVGTSQYVTKKEAMNVYCLPEGSIAVCTYEEKVNPHNSKFKPMKLYKRDEVRYYAHKRYGGLNGLIKERNKRRQRKLEKDMNDAKDIFK
jgi:DNA-repair protein complementing XP-A cells